MKKLVPLAALVLLQQIATVPAVHAQASAAQAAGRTKPSPLAPSEIVAAAPNADWTGIAPSDLLVMELTPDGKGKPRRVMIQLMPPPFSQGWTGNIRKLAAAHWWDGLSINRVQDNYVVQWGDANADDKAKAKALPAGLATTAESQYTTELQQGRLRPNYCVNSDSSMPCPEFVRHPLAALVSGQDVYAKSTGFFEGFPIAIESKIVPLANKCLRTLNGKKLSCPSGIVRATAWPIHCYGMVGVGRDLSPNTGSGAELYVVIGHAPRHLDRNIALVGRVIEGIEFLSSLPRGHGGLGFYDLEQGDERVTITSIRRGAEVKDLPAYQYLSTNSARFAKYADARANRRDAFFISPAGGADICNIPVPVRRAK